MENNKDEIIALLRQFIEAYDHEFEALHRLLDGSMDRFQNLENRLSDLTDVRNLRQELLRAEYQCAKNTAEIAVLKNNLKNTNDQLANYEVRAIDVKSRVEEMQQRTFLLADRCEVKFSGVPVNLDNRDATLKILKAIGLNNMSFHVFEVRDWLAEAQKSQFNETKIIVARLSSSDVRDLVVASSYKLKHKTCEMIFQCGGEGKISINAMWPKKVYELYRLALSVSKELNYAKPVISKLAVCMRETKKSPLILIDFPEDLMALKPRKL